jgi:Tfp pilus assembly protein FimT
VELLVVVAVIGILARVAAPQLAGYLSNGKLRAGGDALYASALLAKDEAIKRNGTVQLVVEGATVRVVDAVQLPSRQLHQHVMPDGVFAAQTTTVSFGSEGRPIPFGSAYQLALAYGDLPCQSPRRCPVLQVDAGGEVRLCADASLCP